MKHTLTAVFHDPGDAQHALNKLLAAGYLRADATLSSTAPAGRAAASRKSAGPDEEHGLGDATRNFFAQLRGTRHGYPTSDSGAFAGERYVLTLMTESEPEAERAVELVERLIPAECENGSSDDGDAAYRYGNEMHMSDKYRNRSWNEVNDDLKRGWELRNSGATWEASSPAIRRGWDAAIPDIDEDSYYRSHWNARYGHDARGKTGHASATVTRREASQGFQYHMRKWTTAAADRKTGWTMHHLGELPPWERFKDAVFHGWSRISLGNDDTGSAHRAGALGSATSANGDNDVSPAYRFGDEMHHADRFWGCDWEDVEKELHDDWDSRYGGRGIAAWDSNRVEVRHGWDRANFANLRSGTISGKSLPK